MSSKFARNMRHRSKPPFCKKPPPPGPVDPGWPPRTGTGYCYWRGTNPFGPDYDCAGLAEFVWQPAEPQYFAQIHQANDFVEVRATLITAPLRWNVYYEYWQAGAFKRAGYSYHPSPPPGSPIHLDADFWLRPDYTQHITFSFSAFPLL